MTRRMEKLVATLSFVAVALATSPAPVLALAPGVTPRERAWCRFWADYLTFPWWRDYAYRDCIYYASLD